MNQEEIHNLLLLLLLLSNEQNGADDSEINRTAVGSLNELIIASMLINGSGNGDAGRSGNNCACRNRNNGSATF